jgi:hypothetical protein
MPEYVTDDNGLTCYICPQCGWKSYSQENITGHLAECAVPAAETPRRVKAPETAMVEPAERAVQPAARSRVRRGPASQG